MRTLSRLAAAGHIAGTLLTIVAPNFAVLFAATLIIGIANGLVEAFVNPLVATLYPRRQDDEARGVARVVPRRHRDWRSAGLRFHAGGPGLAGQDAAAAGAVRRLRGDVRAGSRSRPPRAPPPACRSAGMAAEIGRPLFLVVWLCMWLTAATELGPGQWYANIFNEVMQSGTQAGIILLVWVNGIMYVMRQFFGGIPHRVSPTLLIAVNGADGRNRAVSVRPDDDAADVVRRGCAAGDRHRVLVADDAWHHVGALPARRAAAAGDHRCVGRDCRRRLSGPVMGWINDRYGAAAVLPMWALLPAILTVIFLLIYLSDRARGGYRIERIERDIRMPSRQVL